MTSGLATFQKLSIKDLAAGLDLHPHEVVRVLVANDALTDDLRFDAGTIERVRELGGVQTWWTSAPPADDAELGKALGARFIEQDATSEEKATRFDNLLRGAADDRQRDVRRAAQRLLKAGHLKTCSSATGLRIYATESGKAHLSG